MIRLWSAEGFVQEKHGKTIDEVAEGYLNELVNRSLIQIVYRLFDGTPTLFRIHDLLREYIVSKSRHENFIASIRGNVRWANKIRRIALDASSYNMQECYSFDHLRSLLWIGSKDSSCVVILRKVLGRRCKLLKVLYLRGAPMESIPDEVFKLYHLKYLSLSGTKVKLIPKSIKNLVNLETLDLYDTEVTQLPTEIVKLKKLWHLLVGKFKEGIEVEGFQGPNVMGHLTSLQTLVYLRAKGVNTVLEIGKLAQLRILCLTELRREDGKDLCSSLSKLSNLKVLNIEGEVIDLEHPMSTSSFPCLQNLLLRGCLEKISHWAPSLVGLTELYLERSRLRRDQDPLERIQGLPNLLYLVMDLAYEGEGLILKTGGFQRLKKLDLVRLENLRWVKVEEGCMPHLDELNMRGCKLMAEEPEGLQNLLHLRRVTFTNMSDKFVNRHKKSELDHVPDVGVYSWMGSDRMDQR